MKLIFKTMPKEHFKNTNISNKLMCKKKKKYFKKKK